LVEKCASLIPGSWIDKEQLIGGMDITTSCIAVAKKAKIGMAFVTAKYLQSANCLAELEGLLGYNLLEKDPEKRWKAVQDIWALGHKQAIVLLFEEIADLRTKIAKDPTGEEEHKQRQDAALDILERLPRLQTMTAAKGSWTQSVMLLKPQIIIEPSQTERYLEKKVVNGRPVIYDMFGPNNPSIGSFQKDTDWFVLQLLVRTKILSWLFRRETPIIFAGWKSTASVLSNNGGLKYIVFSVACACWVYPCYTYFNGNFQAPGHKDELVAGRLWIAGRVLYGICTFLVAIALCGMFSSKMAPILPFRPFAKQSPMNALSGDPAALLVVLRFLNVVPPFHTFFHKLLPEEAKYLQTPLKKLEDLVLLCKNAPPHGKIPKQPSFGLSLRAGPKIIAGRSTNADSRFVVFVSTQDYKSINEEFQETLEASYRGRLVNSTQKSKDVADNLMYVTQWCQDKKFGDDLDKTSIIRKPDELQYDDIVAMLLMHAMGHIALRGEPYGVHRSVPGRASTFLEYFGSFIPKFIIRTIRKFIKCCISH